MSKEYDAIVVGARCAGSPTAMLLAKQGYRVLLVDKTIFPSDTMSTHLLHPPAVAALHRWGILDRLATSGCPPVTRYIFDFGEFAISGSPRAADGITDAYCPRRTILDELLVEAAAAAGAELREAFTVDGLLTEDGRVTGIKGRSKDGTAVTERARVVVGADGRRSLIAAAVEAPTYNARPPVAASYYAYWSNLETEGLETYIRSEHRRAWGAIPTHDGLTVMPFGWPIDEFTANRGDIEGNFLKALELEPKFAERVRGAKRETRFVGAGDLGFYFRQPYGPGWALVGDAAYHKDPITAYGITDAFHDAERLATALDDVFAGRNEYDEALGEYQHSRDEDVTPSYELTHEFAQLLPPPPQMQMLLGAVSQSQPAMNDFVSVIGRTLPAPEFFAEDNVEQIVRASADSSWATA